MRFIRQEKQREKQGNIFPLISHRLKSLLPGCHRVIVTKAGIDRALPAETLYEASKQHVSNIKIIPRVADALNYAINTTPKKDAVCVAGSLYVVGEAKEAFEAENQRQ